MMKIKKGNKQAKNNNDIQQLTATTKLQAHDFRQAHIKCNGVKDYI